MEEGSFHSSYFYPIGRIPVVTVAGRETSVTFTNDTGGRNWQQWQEGRNQEPALDFALNLRYLRRLRQRGRDGNNRSDPGNLFYDVVLASIGRDGMDSPTDAKWVVVDVGTVDWIKAIHSRCWQKNNG